MQNIPVVYDKDISEYQVYLFNEGTNYRAYEFLGAHKTKNGWRFCVWAPNALNVSVVGEFNCWQPNIDNLNRIGTTGVWWGEFSTPCENQMYKYAIKDNSGKLHYKADPFAFYSELRPGSASKLYDISKPFEWSDTDFIQKRSQTLPYDKPMLIYEVHAGSWRTHSDGTYLSYRELADELCIYLLDMGYTHIEFMPICEYPFDGSWGYQPTGFFAPTSRYGTCEDLKYAINKFHSCGIGVIMDWVSAHFPKDAFGLYMFDGVCEYEYPDTRIGEHKEWGTCVFDYSKGEVVSFLLSSAYFWVKEYHFDGLRVDAVSSMLYRDYNRKNGEWVANIYGGKENIEAINFLQNLNKIMFRSFPNILMIAEESTSWSNVTSPVENGGLGFNFKWNMGWMNDTLKYMSMDHLFRRDNHNLLTFLMFYAYSENFILPLSHDEVVHGKRSLIDKMFGTYDEKFEAYKALLGIYTALPGKKLIFMGGEFGQFLEWRYYEQLEWNVLDIEKHRRLKEYVRTINHFYRHTPQFWEQDTCWDGFNWIKHSDNSNSVISFMRKAKSLDTPIIVVSSFTPVCREYTIGVPNGGYYEIVADSSDIAFGGNRENSKKLLKTEKKDYDGFEYSINFEIMGLSTLYIKKSEETEL